MKRGDSNSNPRLGIAGWIIVLAAFTIGIWTGPAWAQSAAGGANSDTRIEYRVKQGDTLIALSRDYFLRPGDWRQVRTLNRIANPRRLQVGRTIAIPTRILRSAPVLLRVDSFTGPVRIEREGSGVPARAGLTVPEGAVVRTGAEAFVTLAAAGGDTVSLPSQTGVRVLRSRRYLINDRLDVLFGLTNGRATFAPTPKREGDRWRVRTPVAVTAVRGTTFRVFHDESANRSGTEVVEGTVALNGAALDDGEGAVSPAAPARALEAGFGNVATPAGLLPPEQLLPPPGIVDPGRVQTDAEVVFALEPLSTASGYRVQIARDAGFLEVVAQNVVERPEARFEDIGSGTYFVRARAIAASGLEGLSEAFSFRRQQVAATVEESPLAGGFKFAWRAVGEGSQSGAAAYDFRLWREGAENRPLVAELGMAARELVLTDLPPGVYFWRVTVVQPGDDGLNITPGSPQKLTVSP